VTEPARTGSNEPLRFSSYRHPFPCHNDPDPPSAAGRSLLFPLFPRHQPPIRFKRPLFPPLPTTITPCFSPGFARTSRWYVVVIEGPSSGLFVSLFFFFWPRDTRCSRIVLPVSALKVSRRIPFFFRREDKNRSSVHRVLNLENPWDLYEFYGPCSARSRTVEPFFPLCSRIRDRRRSPPWRALLLRAPTPLSELSPSVWI